VFGHTPRGPLKLLKEVWLAEEVSDDVLTRVSDVHDILSRANDLALQKLKESQGKMKTWYARKARTQTFHPGDQVLVLLPLLGSPLQARYCGPYTIEKKTSEYNHVISTPDRRKMKWLGHVNMLKPYHSKDSPVPCKSVTTATPVMPPESETVSEEVV